MKKNFVTSQISFCYLCCLFISADVLFILIFLFATFQYRLGKHTGWQTQNYPNYWAIYTLLSFIRFSQSAGAVEYTDCTSAEGEDPPNECPDYDTKQSGVEVPVMPGLWGMRSTLCSQVKSGPEW